MLVPRRASPFSPPLDLDDGELTRLALQDGVSNIAINDAFMLEAAIYYLLKKHFRQEKYYVDLLEIFHEVRPLPLCALSLVDACTSLTDCACCWSAQVTFQTELGQLIDLITAPEDSVDLSKFSLDKCASTASSPSPSRTAS